MRKPFLVLTGPTVLAAAAMLAAGCGAPVKTAATAASQKPVVAATSPVASPVAAPVPALPVGPPPKKGTVAWYLWSLPTFAAPPAPTRVTTLPNGGRALQVDRVDTGGQKVAFITIDDGWEKDPAAMRMLEQAHIPFTMFLTTNAIKSDPGFFKRLQALGGVVEDHTITHGKLTQMSYAQQVHEICGSRAALTRLYGRAPVIMRAPYGLSNSNTLKAAASCGIRANVFWDEYAITGTVSWQRPGGIQPGDMVLMHFDKYFKPNLLSSLQAMKKNGITPARLEDYLVTSPATPVTAASPSPSPTS
jgi:peptidoglycan/xylan/chitin deacetylase (PgdA/CDA1 family)